MEAAEPISRDCAEHGCIQARANSEHPSRCSTMAKEELVLQALQDGCFVGLVLSARLSHHAFPAKYDACVVLS